MSLADEYKRQFAWRAWAEAMSLVPPLDGKTVLDLGCAIGDQTAQLVARGAYVIGLDADDALLATAQSRNLPNADFRRGDLRSLQDIGVVDGIWCSFAAAYVPELGATLNCWKKHLEPEGWVVLTEVDDLFGHEPVAPRTRAMLAAYTEEALTTNRYDFRMGRKLHSHLEQAGFTVTRSITIVDQELSFDGPASTEVLEAWKTRFDRMRLLRTFCGEHFEGVRDDFLSALTQQSHRSLSKVYGCVGRL
jgi:SAM-dependent methyltransferase